MKKIENFWQTYFTTVGTVVFLIPLLILIVLYRYLRGGGQPFQVKGMTSSRLIRRTTDLKEVQNRERVLQLLGTL